MILPSDNNILLSLINTALRDKYGSLAELCEEEELSEEEVRSRLKEGGFEYNDEINSFV